MSIIFYSNLDTNSKYVIKEIVKYNMKDLYFICVDKTTIKDNELHVYLENGHQFPLPRCIYQIPALSCLNQKNIPILFGNDILFFLTKKKYPLLDKEFVQIQFPQQQNQNVNQNQNQIVHDGPPNGNGYECFSGSGGVISDKYSFVDLHPSTLPPTPTSSTQYVSSQNPVYQSSFPSIETKNSNKLSDDINISSLKEQRDKELHHLQNRY
jgi:hypothetical protein